MNMLSIFLFLSFLFVNNDVQTNMESNTCSIQVNNRSVVFRRDQKLKTNDGWSVCLYTNRRLTMYAGNKLVLSGTYKLSGSNIQVYGKNGDLLEVLQYSRSRNGLDIEKIVFNTGYEKIIFYK